MYWNNWKEIQHHGLVYEILHRHTGSLEEDL